MNRVHGLHTSAHVKSSGPSETIVNEKNRYRGLVPNTTIGLTVNIVMLRDVGIVPALLLRDPLIFTVDAGHG